MTVADVDVHVDIVGGGRSRCDAVVVYVCYHADISFVGFEAISLPTCRTPFTRDRWVSDRVCV